MSVHGAAPGEIYEDAQGNRWIVMWTIREPSLCAQRLQPRYRPDDDMPQQQSGGVSGLMWQGFKKVLEAPDEKREER